MEANVKACVLNAHTGNGWFPAGQKRLVDTLRHHGWNWDILALSPSPDQFAAWNMQGCPYNVKAWALQEAISQGYERILWLDCSVWPVRNPNAIMDIINQQGWYFWQSGFSIGQTCNTRTLERFGLTRLQALRIPEISTSMFGLHLGNPKARTLAESFIQLAREGYFEGKRDALPSPVAGQLFEHRQDQSVGSLLTYQLGMNIHAPNTISAYANDAGQYPESVIFVMRGM